MDWRDTNTPVKEEKKESGSIKSNQSKNKSLHERAQSIEFKALFNQYLKKRQNSNKDLQPLQEKELKPIIRQNLDLLQMKSERNGLKKHSFVQTKPIEQKIQQNISDLENKDTLPNQTSYDTLSSLIIKMQNDMNEIKANLEVQNKSKSLIIDMQKIQDPEISQKNSSTLELSDFHQQIVFLINKNAELIRELNQIQFNYFSKETKEISQKIEHKLDLINIFRNLIQKKEQVRI